MVYNKNKIKSSMTEKENTLVKVAAKRFIDNKIVFSFPFFNGKSIRINGFNNFYANDSDAIKSVGDFFQTLKDISGFNIREFFSPAIKVQFHYNEFNSNKIIDRIEEVLMNGYNMPRRKIDEFEKLYFEFSFSNGKRAIGTKSYDNIFEILFVDCNHMICIESCRNYKKKMQYDYPSYFGRFDKAVDVHEFEREELLAMLIDSAKSEAYSSLEKFILDYDDLLGYV